MLSCLGSVCQTRQGISCRKYSEAQVVHLFFAQGSLAVPLPLPLPLLPANLNKQSVKLTIPQNRLTAAEPKLRLVGGRKRLRERLRVLEGEGGQMKLYFQVRHRICFHVIGA